MSWLLRFFFAASVAFRIPVNKMFTMESFWKGLIISIVCTLSKLASTIHMGDIKWIMGWALVSRGELSYLIAEFGIDQKLIDDETYSIIIWGLMISTIFPPSIFIYLVKKYKNGHKGGDIHLYKMIIQGYHHEGFQYEITKLLYEKHLDISECDSRLDQESNTEKYVYIIFSKNDDNIDDEMRNELKEEIIGMGGGYRINVNFETVDKIKKGYLEIILNGTDIDAHRKKLVEII